MNKAFVLFVVSLFLIAGNVAAVDLSGTWSGSSMCYGGLEGEFGFDFEGDDPPISTVTIEHDGDHNDFISSYNEDSDEHCYGVIVGNKISMTCPAHGVGDKARVYSFGYGEIKGKTIHYISHVPEDGKTCKITLTPFVEEPEE